MLGMKYESKMLNIHGFEMSNINFIREKYIRVNPKRLYYNVFLSVYNFIRIITISFNMLEISLVATKFVMFCYL